MRFLRRNTPPAHSEPPPSQPVSDDTQTGRQAGSQADQPATAGKGRPTPKRRDAEARRRGPAAPPPRTQREAMRRQRGTKEERRTDRAERRARMLAGDDKYLLPRDRGAVRAYVRDLVDSRRHLMGLFMPLAVAVLLSLFIPDPRFQSAISLLTMAMLAVIIIETAFLGRQISRRVREKFPNSRDGAASLAFYAFSRATMLRRWRTPRQRVGPGDKVD